MVFKRCRINRFALAANVGAIGLASFLFVQGTVSAGQARVAFTATIRETAYRPSGEVGIVQTVLYAVRSDGSTVYARTLNGPGNRNVASQRRIVDLASGEEIYIDGLTDSTTTLPLTKKAVEYHKLPPQCADQHLIERSRMLGYEVIQTVEHPVMGGSFRSEETWRAPALNCFSIKETLVLGNTKNDSRVASVKEVLQVMVGEPSASLFELPTGYQERSPVQRRQEFMRRYPEVPCPSCLKDADSEAEQLYSQRQRDRGN